ncbi:cobalt ECF transporter T component CbiQ [Corynebacterium pseudopelargi]|uniref:Cobalt transport protein CbiQ n=1 Tax=Corynebacterium pseudopelargi TaxID=2080757 RepID=A0A3G6IV39_9CORY|nr:cobalt ECF transporter T component CbiQ [Corynebacterium pseudopelargi]AZA09639.1 Cobalt transport protein CbiQ [Corynebacterium pseudopelargi]
MNPLERAAASSPWATRHVGEKAALLLGLVLVCVILTPGWVSILIAATLVWVIWVAKVPLKILGGLMAPPLVFIFVSVIPMIVAISPQGLIWVPDGPHTAAMLIIRSALATCATIVFSLTTPMPEIFQWLRQIKVPAYLVHVIALTYTMTATLLMTAKTMWDAQAMRLGHSNRRRWMRSLGAQAASLFVHAFERGRRLEAGLELRADPSAMDVLVETRPLNRVFLALSFIWLALLCVLGVIGAR